MLSDTTSILNGTNFRAPILCTSMTSQFVVISSLAFVSLGVSYYFPFCRDHFPPKCTVQLGISESSYLQFNKNPKCWKWDKSDKSGGLLSMLRVFSYVFIDFWYDMFQRFRKGWQHSSHLSSMLIHHGPRNALQRRAQEVEEETYWDVVNRVICCADRFPGRVYQGSEITNTHTIHGTGIFTYTYHKNQPKSTKCR